MRGIVARYGSRAGITFFVVALRFGGLPLAYLCLYFVVTYYVLFRPSVRTSALPYLRRRFPGRGRLALLRCTWRHVLEFSQVLVDEAAAVVCGPGCFAVDVRRREELRGILNGPSGVVLVTTHAGNWKAMVPMLPVSDKQVNLLLHQDSTAPTSGRWGVPEDLRKAKVIDPTGPFGGLVEAASALDRGEIVAIMGDRHWGGRTTVARFLGDPVDVPVAPYRLAGMTGARVVAVLTAKTATRRYELDFSEVLGPGGMQKRVGCTETELAQDYLAFVESFLARHPFCWFNFFDLWQTQPGPDGMSPAEGDHAAPGSTAAPSR